MIFETFKLNKNPFQEGLKVEDIQLDPRFKLALEPLLLLPNVGDIATLIGRTGTGKTTLLQKLMDVWKVNHDVYYLHLGNLKGAGLFRAILMTLGERPRMGKDRMFQQVYQCLAKKQRCLCLLIDEAQLMDTASMTDLRLLGANPELRGRLKLVFSGQPLLLRTLQTETLTDLRERICMNLNLKSMTLAESHAYLEHRLKQAGAKSEIFDEAAIKLMYRHSEGIPRRINKVALKAMMNAWAKKEATIDEMTMKQACEADQS
jgi:type II secretory pathway predicted ATPase ExeA|tara:strand:+ start:144 stop:926 length:783 start_codon:yes stop_codon:yes gene_type:complete